MKKYPKKFLTLLNNVKAKRPRTVIEHILKYGQITTEELKENYGYNHPPRAVRDVREQGIPIITFHVANKDGRNIAAYKFGDLKDVRAAQLSGRTAFSEKIKNKLIEKYGLVCNIYMKKFPVRELQIDHRVPFEIAGETFTLSAALDNYMLLSPSANRAKSWSCENCINWQQKQVMICKTCYWAYPESYKHIAMRDVRRVDIIWSEKEISEYNTLTKRAKESKKALPVYVKEVLRQHIKKPKC